MLRIALSLSIWPIEHSMSLEVLIKAEEATTKLVTLAMRMAIRGNLRDRLHQ
jgi:hypothetical protein